MLISLNDMKAYLGIALLDLSYDTFLTFQIQLVSEAMEEYCNRKFSPIAYTQTFYRKDFERLPIEIKLHQYPIISMGPIVEKEELLDAGIAVTDYRYHGPSGTLDKNFGAFFSNGKHLEVQYTAGYVVLPATLQSVLYGIVQERFNKKLNGVDLNFGSDVQRISIPGTISLDFDYSLNNNERKTHLGQILGSYINILDGHRSERTIIGDVRAAYVV